MKHVILDTDIGGDPDDAFALILYLKSPEISLDLIVTSDEHQGHRAAFTRELLRDLGHDVPVVEGADLGHDKYCLVCGLGAPGAHTARTECTRAIRNVVERNELTHYVCISPQSNLAAFLASAPELLSRIKVTIMGGALQYRTKGEAEHNIRYDLEAARSVFASDVEKRYVFSDTTFRPELRVDREHACYRAMRALGSARLMGSIDRFFDKHYPRTFMHDPLTAATIINHEFVQFDEKMLTMSERGEFLETPDGRRTAVSVDAHYKEFMDFLENRLRLE